jgi:NADH:ubiquinone oxidoreductase subunit
MEKNRIKVLLVAMLILGIAIAPVICAAEENSVQKSLLKFDNSGKKMIVDSELSVEKDNSSHNIQTGSIVHYSDGITTVFDSEGKQSFFAIDEETTKVSTPSGMKAATHVFEIPSESEINTKGNITNVYNNGQRILTIIDENSKKSETTPDFSGWLEASVDRDIDDVSYFRAYWLVPDSPSNPNDDAVDFLFNAIEPNGESGIIQPVLEWNQAGSDRWTGAAWCGKNGIYFHSTRINVDEDDVIKGLMTWDDNNNRWLISFRDLTDGTEVSLYSALFDNTDVDVFTTLESKYVEDNDDLPGDTTFYNMLFKDVDSNAFTVSWDEKYYSGVPSAINGLNVIIYSSSQVKLQT